MRVVLDEFCCMKDDCGFGTAIQPFRPAAFPLSGPLGNPVRGPGGLRGLVDHRVGVLDAVAVCAGMLAEDVHEGVVVLAVPQSRWNSRTVPTVVMGTAPAWTQRRIAASWASAEVAPQASSTM